MEPVLPSLPAASFQYYPPQNTNNQPSNNQQYISNNFATVNTSNVGLRPAPVASGNAALLDFMKSAHMVKPNPTKDAAKISIQTPQIPPKQTPHPYQTTPASNLQYQIPQQVQSQQQYIQLPQYHSSQPQTPPLIQTHSMPPKPVPYAITPNITMAQFGTIPAITQIQPQIQPPSIQTQPPPSTQIQQMPRTQIYTNATIQELDKAPTPQASGRLITRGVIQNSNLASIQSPPTANSSIVELDKAPTPKASGRLITRAVVQNSNHNSAVAAQSAVEAKTMYRSDSDHVSSALADMTLSSFMPGNKSYLSDVDLSGLSPGQSKAVEAVLYGKNILLTGPAGTGKSHVISRIRDIFEKRGLKVGMTSTTGKSAILVNGKTIHSWSGIGICSSKESALKRVMGYAAPQERIRTTNLLIIDEVSMMSSYILDILDYIFRLVRNAPTLSFGGMQVILCGDFYQLKPVKSDSYAFDSENWDKLIGEVHDLTYIFRQTNDAFCKALNEIRIGEVSESTMMLFAQCIGRQFTGDIKPTELFPTNDDVSQLNEAELWKLASETNMVQEFQSLDELIEKPKPRKPLPAQFYIDYKKNLDKNCVAPEFLQLCVGAQVMLIHNVNVEAGMANGSRGVIVGFGHQKEPVVKFLNEQVVYIQKHTWTMKINDTTRMRRTQYPIVLSWAISIHKSQGSTLDLVNMDLGGRVFGTSMIYTALSRSRTLEGLGIRQIEWDKVVTDQRVKAFYAKYSPKK